jgi:proton-dependent oligopeptide transporter, POT family
VASSITITITIIMVESSFMTPVVWCILITETAERFAYFGFRAILVLYFTNVLQYSDETAIALFAYMTSLAYLAPLPGAMLADGPLGRYTTILWFGVIYSIGLTILTISAFVEAELQLQRSLAFTGLFLVCLGTGGIKPCVSAFGADQVAHMDKITAAEFKREASERDLSKPGAGDILAKEVPAAFQQDSERVRAFFASFYFCINLGAVTSIAIIPIVRSHYGFGAAFLIPTTFICLSMLAFLSKNKEYVHQAPGETSLSTTFSICFWLIRHRLGRTLVGRMMPCIRPKRDPIPGLGDDGGEALHHGNAQLLADSKQALHGMPIMAFFCIYWMMYDQQGSVWTLQANRMALHGLQPEQLTVINPVEIMIFLPLFDRIIYPGLERCGIVLSHIRRIKIGMILTSISFAASGFVESTIQYREDNDLDQISVFWQFPQITLLAVSEIFISVTGLEFAYATSPDSMKAFIMSIYLLTTSVGDLFGGLLYSSVFQTLNRATTMHVCAVMMLGNFGVFLWVSAWWERIDCKRREATVELAGEPKKAGGRAHLET